MGIALSCILIMAGTVADFLGISFYFRNIKYKKSISVYVLLIGWFSAMWCISYGLIGFMENFDACGIIRAFGVFAIDAFLVVECFLLCSMIRPKRPTNILLKMIMLLIGIADFYMYSPSGLDSFFRKNGWTSWYAGQAFQTNRSYHDLFIVMDFVILFSLGIFWYGRNKLKRNRRFIRLLIFANFLIIFFSLPDTFMPLLGKPAFPTSGLGAACCTAVIWYGATQLNYFDIRMGNIAERFLDFVDAGIIVFDAQKKAIIVNNYCSRITGGMEPAEVSPGMIFDINGLNEEEMFETAEDDIYSSRFYDKKHDNAYSVRLNALKDDFGDPFCYLCVFSDVTDEIRAIDKLEVASHAKSRFLAQMSHEIRTPINTVLGMNEMILRKAEDEGIRDYAENIESAGRALLSLINSILDFSRIEDGRMEIIPVKYDTASFITDLINSVRQRAEDKGLEFKIRVDEKLPCTFKGDDVRLSQIIMNLLTNAVKYTEKGMICLTINMESVIDGYADIFVEVKDTGIGIKEEDLDRLFVSFERIDEKRNHNIEGSGLGISIVKELLELMDSRLFVKSTYNEGSVFYFTVRQQIIDETPIGDYNERLKKSHGGRNGDELISAPKARILVVDDNGMNLKVAGQLLSLCDIKPDMAVSGREAMDLMRVNTYDIVFMDHMMPEMDGIETLHELEKEGLIPDETVMIVQTANAIAGMREQYLKEGFADYLPKPVELKQLTEMLKEYLSEDLIEEKKKNVTGADPSAAGGFPDIEGIDWKQAFTNMPDKEKLRELLRTFIDSAESDNKELNSYYKDVTGNGGEEALTRYRIKVHAMKNSAALVGAAELSEEARALEFAAKEGRDNYIKAHHNVFSEHYLKIAGEISKKVFGEELKEKIEIDNDTIMKSIYLLERAMEEFDTTTLNTVSLELQRYSFKDGETEKAIRSVLEAVRDFDIEGFKKAEKEVREILV